MGEIVKLVFASLLSAGLVLLGSKTFDVWSLLGNVFTTPSFDHGHAERDSLMQASQKIVGVPIRDEGAFLDEAFM